MSDSDKLVLRALETYKSAVLAKNVDTLMHLYDPDVRVFDTWGVWSYEGAASWKVAIEGWFSSLQNNRCVVAFDEAKINSNSGFAAMSAVATYTGTDRDLWRSLLKRNPDGLIVAVPGRGAMLTVPL